MNPPAKPRRTQTGFSLIELMVVIVIIGILVGIFSLSLGSFADDETVEDARRLQALIELARDEAGIQGREFGLSFYQQGYEFALLQQAEDEDGNIYFAWFPIDTDRQLRPRSLDENTFLELDIEGKEVVLKFARETDSKEEYLPQIFLFSSGEVDPPFRLRFKKSFSDAGIELEYDLNGLVVEADEGI